MSLRRSGKLAHRGDGISFKWRVESCVSGSNSRIDSTVSPKYSTRTRISAPAANIDDAAAEGKLPDATDRVLLVPYPPRDETADKRFVGGNLHHG